MKKILLVVCTVLLCSVAAFGDEAGQGLPATAATGIKAGAEDLIRSGLDRQAVMSMTRAMVENRFGAEQILDAQKIVKQAYQKGLPTEPIMNKVHEGIAKGVSQEMIIHAMERVRARYSFAAEKADALSQDKTQRDRIMEEVAECIAAGMTEHDIGRLEYQLKYRTTQRPKEETEGLSAETYGAAKDMARQGVRSTMAADVALEALMNHYDARKMKTLRKEFMKKTKDNSARTVADVYFGAIRQGTRLESLDFSSINASGKASGGNRPGSTGAIGVTGGAGKNSSGTGGSTGGSGGSGSGSGRGHGGPGGRP